MALDNFTFSQNKVFQKRAFFQIFQKWTILKIVERLLKKLP